jgi:hypothetical protein
MAVCVVPAVSYLLGERLQMYINQRMILVLHAGTRHYISLRCCVNAQCSILALRRCYNKLLCVTLTRIFYIAVAKR